MGLLKRWNPIRRYRALDLRKARAKSREAHWRETQSVLALIRSMTIIWAGIERMLDDMIAWYHRTGGGAIRWDHPRALSLKLDYIKEMEPDVRFSPTDRATLRAVRLETNRLATERHKLIHGFLHRGPRSRNWTVQRVKYEGAAVSLDVYEYTNSQIQDVLRDMAALATLVSPFARDLCWRKGPSGSGPPQARKPSGRGRDPT